MAGQIRSFGRPNERYTMLSNDFLRIKDFPPYAFRVACYVLSHSDEFHLDQQSIANALGMNRTTVLKAMSDLEAMGLLVRTRCTNEHGHRVADDLHLSQDGFTEDDLAALGSFPLSRADQRREDGPPKEDHSMKKTNKEKEDQVDISIIDGAETPKPPEPGSDDDPDFAAFWAFYPRKIGKGGARVAWRRALKKAAPELIMDGARRYAATRVKQDPVYTAHPSTWLNQERWSDQLVSYDPDNGAEREWTWDNVQEVAGHGLAGGGLSGATS